MKNIKEFASVPKLIKVVIDNPGVIETYGEPIEFWTHDIVSLATYFEFFRARSDSQFDQIRTMMTQFVLLEDGTPALKENEDLPADLAILAINKIGEILGKSQSKLSTSEVGTQVES